VDTPPPNPDTPSLRDTFPTLREAQSAYLGQIDSLQSPDRTTHELIRLACSVILRHAPGIERHAMLAAEFGATWEDVVGTLVLTQPGFGLVPSLEALAPARAGFERGLRDALADLSSDRAGGDRAPDAG
jgi:alkylhydroperoxidase/carboxymuconolactone decarboxylase family protein YurZ